MLVHAWIICSLLRIGWTLQMDVEKLRIFGVACRIFSVYIYDTYLISCMLYDTALVHCNPPKFAHFAENFAHLYWLSELESNGKKFSRLQLPKFEHVNPMAWLLLTCGLCSSSILLAFGMGLNVPYVVVVWVGSLRPWLITRLSQRHTVHALNICTSLELWTNCMSTSVDISIDHALPDLP